MFYPTTCVRLEYGFHMHWMLSGFSRRLGYPRSLAAGAARVLSGSARRVDLPARLGAYALKPAIPSAGGGVTSASPRRCMRKLRNVDRIFHLPRLSAYH